MRRDEREARNFASAGPESGGFAVPHPSFKISTQGPFTKPGLRNRAIPHRMS